MHNSEILISLVLLFTFLILILRLRGGWWVESPTNFRIQLVACILSPINYCLIPNDVIYSIIHSILYFVKIDRKGEYVSIIYNEGILKLMSSQQRKYFGIEKKTDNLHILGSLSATTLPC